MRLPLLIAATVLLAHLSLAAPPPAAARAPAGEEELSLDDLDQLDAPKPGEKQTKALVYKIPTEHDSDRRLLVLPALLVLILGWNVDWKKKPAAPRRNI